MPIIDIDLSKVDDSLIPEGEYQAIVYDVSQRPNRAQDGFNLNWQFKIVGGEYEGRSVYYITSLKENALFKLRDALVALGVPIPEDGKLKLDTEELLTRRCTLVIGQEDYQGRMRNVVKDVLPPKEADADPFAQGSDDEY